MPHGSDIEYAVKKDQRFLRLATGVFTAAKRIFVHGQEMRARVNKVFSSAQDIDAKMTELRLGVNTSLFELIPRSLRRKNVDKLLEIIAETPRGKSPDIRGHDKEAFRGNDGAASEVSSSICVDYAAKQPDADIEAKIEAIDWANDKTLLFVGRIIASKGLQSIIAALPLILDKHPTARLLVVGHGPLREAMEALLWALEHGKKSLIELSNGVARLRAQSQRLLKQSVASTIILAKEASLLPTLIKPDGTCALIGLSSQAT